MIMTKIRDMWGWAGRVAGRAGQVAEKPPSTQMSWPVM
jgi:hypothetical protein